MIFRTLTLTLMLALMSAEAIDHTDKTKVLDAKSSLRKSPCAKLDYCSGHGRCDEQKKECSCYRDYAGKTCNEKSLEGCPNDCSGAGFCTKNENDELVCLCDVGFGGHDCSVHHCKDGCNNQGVCTPNGCECNFGYVGRACEKKTCLNDCSHNVCRFFFKFRIHTDTSIKHTRITGILR